MHTTPTAAPALQEAETLAHYMTTHYARPVPATAHVATLTQPALTFPLGRTHRPARHAA